ncbi:hypothetical protein QBC35DRAFT_526030 [Podospora australis]|uniref:Uncharacterized protein n=1 Tax=Podospora australis TaxID=1536484 RepID=A0AAN7AEG2_9PEZI|nr:hypothetical protein QBC35DRAFT_526030 [Podospora australis]
MPDLNSVPASPHHLATSSRRASQQQVAPQPVPNSPTLNILPSNQEAVLNHPISPAAMPPPVFPLSRTGSATQTGDNTGVGPGPGPVRHPRPMTAVDLHQELEKEQEAVVNRLTRELSILRAHHNESVLSNASSTTSIDPTPSLGPSGGRHIRTSSNSSTRSNIGSVSAASLAGISSPVPIRPSPIPTHPSAMSSVALSRQGSSASRRSRTGSPAPGGIPPTSSYANEFSSYFSAHRIPLSGGTSIMATPGSAASGLPSELSPGLIPATARYEEAALHRERVEALKQENELLKKRVRELERMVRERRGSDVSATGDGTLASGSGSRLGGRPRSDSVSTTTSVAASVATSATGAGGMSVAAQRDRPRVVSQISSTSMGVGVPEEEVKFGESAASSGL